MPCLLFRRGIQPQGQTWADDRIEPEPDAPRMSGYRASHAGMRMSSLIVTSEGFGRSGVFGGSFGVEVDNLGVGSDDGQADYEGDP